MLPIKSTLLFILLLNSHWFLGQTLESEAKWRKVPIQNNVFDSVMVIALNQSDSTLLGFERGKLRVYKEYHKGSIIRQTFFYDSCHLDLTYDVDGIGLTYFQVELDSGACSIRREFYSPSNLKAEGKGDSIINIVEYCENSGNICKKYSMLNHLYHNEFFEYSNDGSLKSLVTYKKGKLEGPSIRYYSNGLIYSHQLFRNGEPIGKTTYFSINGDLIEQK